MTDFAREKLAEYLSTCPYRFHEDRWEVRNGERWIESVTLEGCGYEEGVALIAECPWASMEEAE